MTKVQKEQLEMHSQDAGNDKIEHSLPIITSRLHRRPSPSRKVSEAEEMVKYMSSIPSYLQSEKGSCNIQEKVLNVGVLDWRRLQKWTDHEKQLVANKMNNDSPSSSNLSTFYSSPFSSINNASPPTHERKQSSTLSSTSNLTSSAEKDQRKIRRKDSSKNIMKSQDAGDIIVSQLSASKCSANFALLRSSESTKVARSDELEKLQIGIEQESCRSHLNRDGDRTKHRRKHLEEIIARSILSFDATLLDQRNLRRMNSSRLSGKFSLPPQSSGLSSNTHKEESYHEACIPPSANCSTNSTNHTILEANKNSSFEKIREQLPIVLPRVDLKGRSGSPSKSIADSPNEAVSRCSSTGRRSPMRLFFDQPRKSACSVGSISENADVTGARSSSRGRRSPVKQMILDLDVSVSRSNSKGRRSPLGHMLESPRKSPSLSVNSFQKPQESCGVVDPMHSPSTRQALLKLCWKNGLPLLMFSSSDDSIFVAMMHKRSNPDMNICDCVYEIHTAMAVEVKKKNGTWLSQGTKHRKPEFCCKFVAELIVSSSERVSFDLTHRSFIRELVLLGDELVPSSSSNQNRDATNSSGSTELAAIVIESSDQKLGISGCGNLCSPRIVAILPSGVHGFSNTREPSKLIEKWESGGSCDCGGWDEGCALTILTNNSKQMNNISKSVQDCGTTVDHGTCEFDLFTEGDARKGKPSFSMVSFKEDMFTVEFKASIPLLQAFAISIAILHDQNHLISADHNYEDISFDSYPVISS